MTIVKELNDLSEKLTGVNAKATTDAQAVKFINNNYTGSKVEVDLDDLFIYRYYGDPSKIGTQIEVTNEEDISKLDKIKLAVNQNNYVEVIVNYITSSGNEWKFKPTISVEDNEFAGMELMVNNVSQQRQYYMSIMKDNEVYTITPHLFELQTPSI